MDPALPAWLETRSAGVLAPLSSLPGEFGIGNLGRGAREFVSFLNSAGLTCWQVCPIGPTGYGDSPYQSFCSAAGNPSFIDLTELQAAGLLDPSELAPLRSASSRRVDYAEIYRVLWPALALAADRFLARQSDDLPGYGSFQHFRERHARWLGSYADFMSLKTYFGGEAWNVWPDEFRRWTPQLRENLPPETRRDAARHEFYQYLFFGQWTSLRRFAADHGVRLLGDLPSLVPLDGVETWADHSVFRLGPNGQPLVCAGAPPDASSPHGEVWGNPLYDWPHLARTGYTWWIDRLRSAFEQFDIVRLIHFQTFDRTWSVPANQPDLRKGRWLKGPGVAFFDRLEKSIPHAPLIADDTDADAPATLLRRAAALPGSRILQLAFTGHTGAPHRPHRYPFRCVAYTGTHETPTTRSWLESLDSAARLDVDDYFDLNGATSAWPIIRAALASPAHLVVIPIQDLLDLSGDAVMTRPGSTVGNWQWRFTRDQLVYLSRTRTPTLKRWIELFERDGAPADYTWSPPSLAATTAPS